jgi:hypothetical protein
MQDAASHHPQRTRLAMQPGAGRPDVHSTEVSETRSGICPFS